MEVGGVEQDSGGTRKTQDEKVFFESQTQQGGK